MVALACLVAGLAVPVESIPAAAATKPPQPGATQPAKASPLAGASSADPVPGGFWDWQNPKPDGYPLLGVSCPSATTCYAAGISGDILKSINGGTSWTPTHVDRTIFSIDCPSVNVCIGVGYNGDAVATVNGGGNWDQLPALNGGNTLNSVSCASTTQCSAVGVGGSLVQTNGSVELWTQVRTIGSSDTFNSISCPRIDTCYAVGDNGALWIVRQGNDYSAGSSGTGYLGGVSCLPFSEGDGGGVHQLVSCMIVGANGYTRWFYADPFYGPPTQGWSSTIASGDDLAAVSCPTLYQCFATSYSGVVYVQSGQKWGSAATGENGILYAIDCPNLQKCVAVGDYETAITTGDGGTDWTLESPGTTASLSGISCPSASVCYAVGGSTVDKTSDGGATWAVQPSASAVLYNGGLVAVSCPSTLVCFAVGGGNNLIGTADGGVTWTPENTAGSNYFSGVSCPSSTTCFAVGSVQDIQGVSRLLIYVTTDAGAHWNPQSPPPTVSYGAAISCPSVTTCFIVAGQGAPGTTLSTTDGGANWNSASLTGLTAISCPSTSVCFAVGPAKVVNTTNGGTNWNDQTPNGTTDTLNAVSCASTTHCTAIAENGDVLATSDGSAWLPQTSATTRQMRGISCPSTTECVASGIGGFITATYDSGAHWKLLQPGSTENLKAVSCPSATRCYAVEATHGGIYSSADGVTWAQVFSASGVPFSDISCASASVCFAASSAGSVYSTIDSGQTWPSKALGQPFTGISCPTTGMCTAVDSTGHVSVTTDGGANWSPPVLITASGLTDVSCASVSVCSVTSAIAPGQVFSTSDGWADWRLSFDLSTDPSAGSTAAFKSISCLLPSVCYAAGDGGLIASTDDGLKWRTDNLVTAANVTDISCVSFSTCFASGDDSTIFRTTNAGGGWDWQFGATVAAFRGISCPSASTCFAVGDGGAIAATTTGASSWSTTYPLTSTPLITGAACPASNLCLAVGQGAPGAHFLSTANGGSTWSDQTVNSYDLLQAISCPTATTCYAVGWPGSVYKTTNAGGTWAGVQTVLRGSDTTLASVSCATATFCVAVGTHGTVFVTTNGTAWNVEGSGTTSFLGGVSCPTTSLCVAVGVGGLELVRSGGSWHPHPTGTTNTLSDVECPSTTICYVSGFGGTLLKSTNGGLGWIAPASGTTDNLYGIDCLRTTICMAVGANGTGVLTVNGNTWIDQSLPSINSLHAVAFWDTNHIYAFGEGGTIFSNQELLDVCDSATLSWEGPQAVVSGTPFHFAAAAGGCTTPEFKFFLQRPGGSWIAATPWGGNTWTWTTYGEPAGTYGVGVWAREQGSAAKFEAYFLGTVALLSSACSSVGLTTSKGAPQPPGSVITLTANPTGCNGTYYRFWILPPGGKWTLLHDWQTPNTYDWNTAGRAPGTYELGVWLREYGAPTYQAYGFTTFTLGSTACSSAHATSDTAEPGYLWSTISLTATSNGCTSPQYQFWYQPPGGKWTITQAYSSSDTWSWMLLGAPGTYQYGVWVKQSGSTNAYDAYYIGTFRVTGAVCTAGLLSTNEASPLKPGNPVDFVSGATGCELPYVEYWVLKPNSTTWVVLRPYSTTTGFTWNTTGLAPGPYRIGVWVRMYGSERAYDSYAQLTMWIGT